MIRFSSRIWQRGPCSIYILVWIYPELSKPDGWPVRWVIANEKLLVAAIVAADQPVLGIYLREYTSRKQLICLRNSD